MIGLTTSVRRADRGPVVAIAGELDHATADKLRATLTDLPLTAGEVLVLDLTGLHFCDSSGLAVFLLARNQAQACGASIALTGVPPHTARMLRLTGLDEVLPVQGEGLPAPD